MADFLQTYGGWIIFGLLLVLMFRMHAGGHSHGGMMHHEMHGDSARRHRDQYIVDADPVKESSTVLNQNGSGVDGGNVGEASSLGSFGGKTAATPDDEAQSSAHGSRHAGCH